MWDNLVEALVCGDAEFLVAIEHEISAGSTLKKLASIDVGATGWESCSEALKGQMNFSASPLKHQLGRQDRAGWTCVFVLFHPFFSHII